MNMFLLRSEFLDFVHRPEFQIERFLEFRILDDGQSTETQYSECCTQSSEPLRFYLFYVVCRLV
jgi:hypothetical protein